MKVTDDSSGVVIICVMLIVVIGVWGGFHFQSFVFSCLVTLHLVLLMVMEITDHHRIQCISDLY